MKDDFLRIGELFAAQMRDILSVEAEGKRSTIVYGEEPLQESKAALEAFTRFFERYQRIAGESFYQLVPIVRRDEGELPAEGMLYVGEKGKILAGFRGKDPHLIPQRNARDYAASSTASTQPFTLDAGAWIKAFKGGEPTCGDFLLAGPISDAFNLGAISLRLGGKRLVWDAAKMTITNRPEVFAWRAS